jgi:hypothetical protein
MVLSMTTSNTTRHSAVSATHLFARCGLLCVLELAGSDCIDCILMFL